MNKDTDPRARPVTWGRMTMCEVMPSPRAPLNSAEEPEGGVSVASPSGPGLPTEVTERCPVPMLTIP